MIQLWSACAHSRTLDAPDDSHMLHKACESEMPNEIRIFRLNGVYSDQNTHHN